MTDDYSILNAYLESAWLMANSMKRVGFFESFTYEFRSDISQLAGSKGKVMKTDQR